MMGAGGVLIAGGEHLVQFLAGAQAGEHHLHRRFHLVRQAVGNGCDVAETCNGTGAACPGWITDVLTSPPPRPEPVTMATLPVRLDMTTTP